ncbi:hypothetical protein ACH5RR_008311 [Cinchona calisaya]|uniref:J domain-containing protein n=1 Tax=Cinchona calisaya TaxID=153742 RepID=A0ABD3AB91_9GENT
MASFSVSAAASSPSWIQLKNSAKMMGKNHAKNCNINKFRIFCVVSGLDDPYKTLRIQPGAAESEVKKAFRQLVLKYHPDVCKGSNCDVEFHKITEAYDIVMDKLREESSEKKSEYEGLDDTFRGMHDNDWDLWEEWMGYEGGGIRDYTSHINPYI